MQQHFLSTGDGMNKKLEEWKEFKTVTKEIELFLNNISFILTKIRECEETWSKISLLLPSDDRDDLITKDIFFGNAFKTLRISSHALFKYIQKVISVHEANARCLVECMQDLDILRKESTSLSAIQRISDSATSQLLSISQDLEASTSVTVKDKLEDPITVTSFSAKLAAWRENAYLEQKRISIETRDNLQSPMKDIGTFLTSSLIQMATERRDHLRSEDAFLEEFLSTLTSTTLFPIESFDRLNVSTTSNAINGSPAVGSFESDSKVVLHGYLRLKKTSIFSTNWPIVFVAITNTPSSSSSFLHVMPVDKCIISYILNPSAPPPTQFKLITSFQKWNNPELPLLVSKYLLSKYFSVDASVEIPNLSFESFCTRFSFPPGSISIPLKSNSLKKTIFIISALVTRSSETLLLKIASSTSNISSLELRSANVPESPTIDKWLAVINDAIQLQLQNTPRSMIEREYNNISPFDKTLPSHSSNITSQLASSSFFSNKRDEKDFISATQNEKEFSVSVSNNYITTDRTTRDATNAFHGDIDDGWSVDLSDASPANEYISEDNYESILGDYSTYAFSKSKRSSDISFHSNIEVKNWISNPIDDPWRLP